MDCQRTHIKAHSEKCGGESTISTELLKVLSSEFPTTLNHIEEEVTINETLDLECTRERKKEKEREGGWEVLGKRREGKDKSEHE